MSYTASAVEVFEGNLPKISYDEVQGGNVYYGIIAHTSVDKSTSKRLRVAFVEISPGLSVFVRANSSKQEFPAIGTPVMVKITRRSANSKHLFGYIVDTNISRSPLLSASSIQTVP